MPICQAGVLHSPSHTEKRKKFKKREKREEVKTTQNYRFNDHGLIRTKLFINVIYPWWF